MRAVPGTASTMDQDWFEKILAAERDGELTEGELRELNHVCEQREDLRRQRVMDKKLGEVLNFGGPRRAPRGFAQRVMQLIDAELEAERAQAARAEAEAARAAQEQAAAQAARPAVPEPVAVSPPQVSSETAPVSAAAAPRPERATVIPIAPPVSRPAAPVAVAARVRDRKTEREERAPWWSLFFGSPVLRAGLGLAVLAIFGFQLVLFLKRGPGGAAGSEGAPDGEERLMASSTETVPEAASASPPRVLEPVIQQPETKRSPDPRREEVQVAKAERASSSAVETGAKVEEPVVTPVPTPELTPEPTPEATPEPTPAATPEPTPKPEATPTPKPSPVPETKPAAVTKSKPEPAPAAAPSPEPAPEAPRAGESMIADSEAPSEAPAEAGASGEREVVSVSVPLDELEAAEPSGPDAKSALEEAMKSASRSPILRIDLAQLDKGPGATAGPGAATNSGGNGVSTLARSGAVQSPDAVKAARRDIELALASHGLIRRLEPDPDHPELLKLRAQTTPSGLRAFVRDIEAQGIVPRGTAGAAAGAYAFERGGLEVFGESADDGGEPKIEIELIIELPR